MMRRLPRGFLAVGLLVGLWPAGVRADALGEVQRRGVLVWGGDQEGGGPYVYPDPQAPARVIGFEVELADLLARHLGVRAQFFQANWDTLPQFLAGGQVDIILNGYELTPGRAARMQATRPYYVYQLQLLSRAGDHRFETWADLRRPEAGRKYTVSALDGSGAMDYLREQLGGAVNILGYDGNTNAMLQVTHGVDDATVQDLPIAIFYRDKPAGEGLRFVGAPVRPGYYVAYARPGEHRLVQALNEGIEAALRDGRLRALYERYGLWNAAQEQLTAPPPLAGQGKAEAGMQVVRRYGPVLLRAAGMTVFLSVTAMPLAILLGLLIALGRMYAPWPVRMPLTLYVEVLRGTPVMLQLFVIFFLLPAVLPFALSPVIAAIVGLAINYSAYEAEIYRAGLQAIPTGQMDAALAVGMSPATALRRIIVPQAVRIVIPPVTNDFIALFKDTSICSVIAVTELTKQYNMLVNSSGAILELAGITAVLYLAMSYPLSLAAQHMERRLAGRLRPEGGTVS
jgi:polar amino acid transport system substrate-binding protein